MGTNSAGSRPYDPADDDQGVGVRVLRVGVFSSRRIERRLAGGQWVSVPLLAAGNAPNFRTIAGFPQAPSGYAGRAV